MFQKLCNISSFSFKKKTRHGNFTTNLLTSIRLSSDEELSSSIFWEHRQEVLQRQHRIRRSSLIVVDSVVIETVVLHGKADVSRRFDVENISSLVPRIDVLEQRLAVGIRVERTVFYNDYISIH